MHVVNAQCRCAVPVVSQSQPARAPATPLPPPSSLLARLRSAAAATSLAAALALAPLNSAALAQGGSSLISNAVPVVDLARVVPSERLEPLNRQLLDLEQATGWRVRMLTRYGPTAEPTLEQLRDGWSVDDKTVVVFVDPSSPNIMTFNFGRGVREVLRPQFFTELQGRYGNMFNVREQGESAAVMGMMDALTGCLAAGGCFAVPGLSADHYFFTLVLSIAGGVIAGSAARIEPQGFVQRREVWILLFSPLWATLFVSFGLGPVLSRTSDVLPLVGNTLGFAAAAAAVGWQRDIAKATGLTVDEQQDSGS